MSQIIPGLFLGGMRDAFDSSVSSGATVINVALEVPKTPYAKRYVHVSLRDTSSEKINIYFDEIAEIIDKELNEGNKVLVHCFAGISRSASIVIAYIMKKYRWSYSKAYVFVKTKRPIVDPNFGFVVQLYNYGVDVLRID